MKILIIEDEVRTANELKDMLSGLDDSIEIEAILGSVSAALNWFAKNPMPELIFRTSNLVMD